MPTIQITAGAFSCEAPVVGSVYRNLSTDGKYLFNWTSEGNLYETYGMTVKMSIWYTPNGIYPYQEYTLSVAPNNAVNFAINNDDIENPDYANFQLRMDVVDINEIETLCTEVVDIPYSTVIQQ